MSFIIQKGKCRHCQQKISWQYPWVELAAAGLFVLAYLIDFNNTWLLARDWLMILFLIVIFVYDLKHELILDKIVLPAVGLALILNLILGYVWWELLIAGSVGLGFYLIQFLISKGRWVGGGDMRLGLMMGFLLGWPELMVALFLAYILGSIVGISLILFNQKGWKSRIPFAPFLTTATLITMFWGQSLVQLLGLG
jgi:prepilin signal peptidase PulO-like enzyme (type II secretory pathway)